MSKSPKRPRDINQLAHMVVDIASTVIDANPKVDVNPMVELGRAGGLKGGVARANLLSRERRQEIARRAATARWSKNDGKETK